VVPVCCPNDSTGPIMSDEEIILRSFFFEIGYGGCEFAIRRAQENTRVVDELGM